MFYADSSVPVTTRSLLRMVSPVPSATRPNKRQRRLTELCYARRSAAVLWARAPARGPRALRALQWTGPRLELGPSDPGWGIRCPLDR
ncbi:hypothetical protein ACRRTK_012754 [Alexandromys fortis]